MVKPDKTNVMRILDAYNIEYKWYNFKWEGISGLQAANSLNLDPNRVFKTLVTKGKSGKYYVFDIPVALTLDLKKAASVVNEKNVEMVKSKDLLSIAGYIHGACSPIGMKKLFVTTFHSTVSNFDKIVFSGGKVGTFVEIKFSDLKKVVNIKIADLTAIRGIETY